MAKDPEIHVIRVWKLPSNFFSLPLEQQWLEVEKVTEKATALKGRREACSMTLLDESLIVGFFLVTLGLVWVLAALLAGSIWYGSRVSTGAVVGTILTLALHPMERFSSRFRTSRLGLAFFKYFTLEILKNVNDPMMVDVGTSRVDNPEFQKRHLPGLFLACPHGVCQCIIFHSISPHPSDIPRCATHFVLNISVWPTIPRHSQ
jgi:hypothetical protein